MGTITRLIIDRHHLARRYHMESSGSTVDRVLGVNRGQQGPIQSHALVKSLVDFDYCWLSFHGCGDSLLYVATCAQSLSPNS